MKINPITHPTTVNFKNLPNNSMIYNNGLEKNKKRKDYVTHFEKIVTGHSLILNMAPMAHLNSF